MFQLTKYYNINILVNDILYILKGIIMNTLTLRTQRLSLKKKN